MKSGVGSALGSPGTFSVPVRKKRGRRAPPSSRCLHGKKDDNVMRSDDAINNSNHVTEEGHAGKSHSIVHIKKSIDWKIGGLDLPKTGFSGNSSYVTASPSSRKTKEQNRGEVVVGSSAGNEKSFCVEKQINTRRIHQDTFHLKHDGVVTDPTGQSVSVNEARGNSRALKNTSNV